MINTVDVLRSARAAQLARIAQLQRRLDDQLFEQLMLRAQELRPQIERDGRGLTELEFSITMLLELDIVKWAQVRGDGSEHSMASDEQAAWEAISLQRARA